MQTLLYDLVHGDCTLHIPSHSLEHLLRHYNPPIDDLHKTNQAKSHKWVVQLVHSFCTTAHLWYHSKSIFTALTTCCQGSNGCPFAQPPFRLIFWLGLRTANFLSNRKNCPESAAKYAFHRRKYANRTNLLLKGLISKQTWKFTYNSRIICERSL